MQAAANLSAQPPVESIRLLLDDLTKLIAKVEAAARHGGPANSRALIIATEADTAHIMNSIGRLADEVLRSGDEDVLARVREVVCVPLAAWSATSAVFHRVRNTRSTEFGSYEITDLILGNLPGGVDVAANILDHYYHNLMISRAFRFRMQRVVEWLGAEIVRLAHEGRSARVLSLLTGPGWELEQVARNNELSRGVQITCVDDDAKALRCVRQRLRGDVPGVRFVRADPRAFLTSRGSAGETFDVIYAVNLLDQLSDDQAQKLINDCCSKLAPGGQMLLANFSLELPRHERILLAWVLNWVVRCRSEDDLRCMLANAGKSCGVARYELDPLQASLLMIAGAATDEVLA